MSIVHPLEVVGRGSKTQLVNLIFRSVVTIYIQLVSFIVLSSDLKTCTCGHNMSTTINKWVRRYMYVSKQ